MNNSTRFGGFFFVLTPQMVKRWHTLCRSAGCMRLATERGHCDRHQSDADRHGWSDARGTASERGYGWKWAKLRQRVLIRDAGLCQRCFAVNRITPASQVDHILPKSAGGSDAMDNLQALCDECHLAKTLAERRAFGRRD